MVRKMLVVAISLMALSACASSRVSGASGLVNDSPSAAPASSAPPASPSPAPTVTVTATATVPAAKPCTVGDVSVTVSDGQGAAGTLVQRFVVTNTSQATCTMTKYPFISPYGLQKQGSTKVEANFDDIKIGPIASSFGDLGGSGGLRTLVPGDTSVFFLKWSDVPSGSSPCDNADGFDFKPPQDTSDSDNKLVALKFTVCGSAVQVSQMLAPSVES